MPWVGEKDRDFEALTGRGYEAKSLHSTLGAQTVENPGPLQVASDTFEEAVRLVVRVERLVAFICGSVPEGKDADDRPMREGAFGALQGEAELTRSRISAGNEALARLERELRFD